MKRTLVVLMLAMLLIAPQAFAFKIFGFEFGGDKEDKKEVQEAVVEDIQEIQQQKKYERREQVSVEPDLVDIDYAIELANEDPYAERFMNHFEGDNFCIESDMREAYATVENGVVVKLEEKPNKCYRIEGTEEYGRELLEKYEAKEYVGYKEVLGNIKTSFNLKLKVLAIFAKEVIS